MSRTQPSGESHFTEAAPLPPPAPLELQAVACGEECIIRLSGDLDLAARPLLDGALSRVCASASYGVIVLDLSGVTFMDSSGIHSVLAGKDLCAQAGCDFRLIPGPAHVQRVFEVSGLLKVLRLEALDAES